MGLLVAGAGVASIATQATATANSTVGEPNTNVSVPYENETITTAYVDQTSDNLTALTSGNHTIEFNVSAEIVGKGENLDDDWYVEIPYITSNGEVYAIDRTGEKQELATDAKSSNTALAATEFQGNPVVVYTTSNNKIRKVYYNGSSEPIVEGGIAGNAALGVGDLTGDDKDELLYLGTSNEQFYYNSSMNSGKTFEDYSLGANGGLGVGAPRDFDDDDKVEVPLIESSPNLYYVGLDGKVDVSVNPGKYPVGSLDVVGNSTPELLYVDSSAPYQIRFVTADGAQSGYLTDADQNRLNTTQSAGVAYVNGTEEPLAVANLSLSNQSGTLYGAFNSSVTLSKINAELTGPDGKTALSKANFTEHTVGSDYRYTTNYTPTTDGDYSLTLTSVAAEDTETANPDLTANATIDERFDVDALNATATATQNLTINVSATEELGSLNITISGAASDTLNVSTFSVNGSGPPYKYTTTVDPGAYGTYNVTFNRGESEDGQVDNETMNDSVTITEPLQVSNLTLVNETGTLTTSFNASRELTGVTLDVHGPDSQSFSLSNTSTTANLTQTSTGGTYTYTGTYTPTSDGDYTANLSAVTTDNASVSPNLTANATVDVRFTITDLRTNTTADRNLGLAFNASDPLRNVTVNISGAETAMLNRSAFTTTASSPPFTYTGAYNRTTDGIYNVTLVRGESTDGQNASPGLEASERINESLTIWNLTLTGQNGTLVTTVQTTEPLAAIDADIDGPDPRSFTVQEFQRTTSDGTYTYTANYTPNRDGEYTAAVTFGRSTDGNTDSPTLTVNATVDQRFNVTTLQAAGSQSGALEINFTATDPIDAVTIDIAGPENTTLGSGAFSTNNTSSPYVYTGSYTVTTPGEYTVTFTEANSTAGLRDTDQLYATATIDELRVWNLTLSNSTMAGNLSVSFQSSKQLSGIDLAITGPKTYNLSRSNFTEAYENGAYTYTADFATTPGTYTGTLVSATSKGNLTVTPSVTASATLPTAFDVASLNATTNGSGVIAITLNATAPLNGLTVGISGPDNATLTLDEFTTTDTTAPYTYTGTYNTTKTGTYDVTFIHGESPASHVDDDQLTDTITIQDALDAWNLTLAAENGTLTTQFTASQQLTEINAVVGGPTNHTSTREDFTEVPTSGNYSYTATCTPPSDGTYTATLTSVITHSGTTQSPDLTANATVDTRQPDINVTLHDQTDGNGIVNGSDRVRIRVNISGDVDTVELTQMPFGNDSVTLDQRSQGVVATNATVGAVSSGAYTVQVRAVDGEQNQILDASNAIIVDMNPPNTTLHAPATIPRGTTTSITAMTVTDEETHLSAAWWLINGAPITNSTNTTTSIQNLTHTFDSAGAHTIRLLAIDAAGNTNNDTATVTVTDPTAGQPPADEPAVETTGATASSPTMNTRDPENQPSTPTHQPRQTPQSTQRSTSPSTATTSSAAAGHGAEMPFNLFGITGSTTVLALAIAASYMIHRRRDD
ncbi:hypothetical protein LPA44_14070 [Halobacterium sp. KA-4]|nr:hypothetical protein [Halobacterium sp. KA-4]